jgi:hypothetical protein
MATLMQSVDFISIDHCMFMLAVSQLGRFTVFALTIVMYIIEQYTFLVNNLNDLHEKSNNKHVCATGLLHLNSLYPADGRC